MKLLKSLHILFSVFALLFFSNFAFATSDTAASSMNGSVAKPMKASKDAEIIAFMEALNNAEINAANEALKRNLNTNVLDFAKMMKDQHEKNLSELMDVSKSINVMPVETKAVVAFKKQSAKELTSLTALDDKKFEKAYVKAMIKDHKKAASMVTKFSSETKNDSLKQYLSETKKAILMHLEHCEKLQTH
jgi:putative membrane protein